MTRTTSTEPEGQFARVTCLEARPGDRHPVIGQDAVFDSWAEGFITANISKGLYRRIFEASRMGWWQFWYRVETTESVEKHQVDAGKTLEMHTWKVFSNRDDMPIYRIILALANEPLRADMDIDPGSDLQSVLRSAMASAPTS